MLAVATLLWMWNLLDIGSGGVTWTRKAPAPAAAGKPMLNLDIRRESLSAEVRIPF